MSYILFIEQDDAIREEITDALENDGHAVKAVTDGEAAKQTSIIRPPVLLIADQHPGGRDMAFLEDLMRDRRLARIPVILLVDPKDMSNALNAYECDIFAILKKPVDIEHLRIQVETVIRQARRQKQSRRRERKHLRSQIMRLEREVRATTEDLTDAAQNFVTMLASPPSPQGIRIDVHYSPSGGFIGGDFYDFFWLDPRRLCVVIGDVSGHGIQAAVIQSMARKVISIAMRTQKGRLRDALQFANEELADDIPSGKFVATLVGVLDVVSGHWAHARCGVPHPIFHSADGGHEEILTAGAALGLKRGGEWSDAIEVYEANLPPEGRILMFTDGIIECVQDDGEEFDYKGIYKVLAKAGPEDNVPELIVRAAHAGHLAQDDVLIISITRESAELEDSETTEFLNEDTDEDPLKIG